MRGKGSSRQQRACRATAFCRPSAQRCLLLGAQAPDRCPMKLAGTQPMLAGVACDGPPQIQLGTCPATWLSSRRPCCSTLVSCATPERTLPTPGLQHFFEDFDSYCERDSAWRSSDPRKLIFVWSTIGRHQPESSTCGCLDTVRTLGICNYSSTGLGISVVCQPCQLAFWLPQYERASVLMPVTDRHLTCGVKTRVIQCT